MNVLQVLGSSAGGVVRHVAEVCGDLAGAGMAVVVAGPDDLAPRFPGCTFVSLPITDRPHPRDARTVLSLRRLAARADVVHAHGLRAGGLAVLATRGLRGGPRVVVTLHNLPVGGRSVRFVSGVLERVVARADVVLGVSGDLVDRARALGATQVARALVPAPVNGGGDESSGSVHARLGLPATAPLIVTVARLAPQKGLDTLAAAARVVRAAAPDAVWLVAGGGPLRGELEQSTAGTGVHVLGPRDDVPALLEAADVVVSTAVWEGQPIAVQEALRAGAAVVATDAGGTREVTGDAAVLVPVGDAEAVAEAVLRVLEDPTELADLRRRARVRAEALPTRTDVVAQLRAAYTDARRA